jgi:hypothetical protein
VADSAVVRIEVKSVVAASASAYAGDDDSVSALVMSALDKTLVINGHAVKMWLRGCSLVRHDTHQALFSADAPVHHSCFGFLGRSPANARGRTPARWLDCAQGNQNKSDERARPR